jgi:hypothetical protein
MFDWGEWEKRQHDHTISIYTLPSVLPLNYWCHSTLGFDDICGLVPNLWGILLGY